LILAVSQLRCRWHWPPYSGHSLCPMQQQCPARLGRTLPNRTKVSEARLGDSSAATIECKPGGKRACGGGRESHKGNAYERGDEEVFSEVVSMLVTLRSILRLPLVIAPRSSVCRSLVCPWSPCTPPVSRWLLNGVNIFAVQITVPILHSAPLASPIASAANASKRRHPTAQQAH